MSDLLVAIISGVGLLVLLWGAWKFLNYISPCEDEDD